MYRSQIRRMEGVLAEGAVHWTDGMLLLAECMGGMGVIEPMWEYEYAPGQGDAHACSSAVDTSANFQAPLRPKTFWAGEGVFIT